MAIQGGESAETMSRRGVLWPRADRVALQARIEQRMAALGLNPLEVADRGGISRSAVYNFQASRKTNLTMEVLGGIAKGLDCSIAYLIAGVDTEGHHVVPSELVGGILRRLPIMGAVEAGAYRLFMRRQIGEVAATSSRQHPNAKHFAMQINDNQMEALRPTPLLRGQIALLVEVAGEQLQSDRVYLVHRRNEVDGDPDKALWETSLWYVRVYTDRVEFAACSPDKSYNNSVGFAVPLADLNTESSGVLVEGLLYSAVRDYEGEILTPPA